MVLRLRLNFRKKQEAIAISKEPTTILVSERVFERTNDPRRLQGTRPSRGTVESSEASERDGTATAPTVITTLFLIIKNIREASLESEGEPLLIFH